ncbi:GNAT family acetyltransferase [Desulfoscipio sp. XC116]|uniref:GNAT family acetyltransferase n=1 Tax=Desulfoscipio sp. XC116 TaxID=3144975 RepID=UPI00325B05A3
MSKMLKVTPNDDYTLLVEFEHGNKIIFNMRKLIETMPYTSLRDLSRFKDITLEEKAIRWPDPTPGVPTMYPVRLTVDNMLFTIRE